MPTPDKEKQLACPDCATADDLQTIETLYGFAHTTRIGADGSIDYAGWTEVDWDSSQSVGAYCGNCGWSYESDDWLAHLMEAAS